MRQIRASLFAFWALSGCAEQGDAPLPYPLGQAMVIGESKGGALTAVDAGCSTAECSAVRARCGEEAFADVVLAEDGTVADVLCYRRDVNVVEVGVDNVETARAGNNTVLVLDAVADGADVTFDVVLAGNNAVLFGSGTGVSLIGGDLIIEKNNAIVRSVTIQGDVLIDKNNAQLAFVEIHGDLTIQANNVTLAESVVFGQVRILGNNTVLAQNELQSAAILTGNRLICNGNVGFEDRDADGIVSPEELGSELACSQGPVEDEP